MKQDQQDLNTEKDIVLVVDLDGTLSLTDTLHDTMLDLAGRHAAKFVSTLAELRNGKVAFKDKLSQTHLLDTDALALNPDVVELVESARAQGRRTALVTATHQLQAEHIAAETGLFDEVHGSDSERNLKGAIKAAFLTDRYGDQGFDYVGDSKTDIPVWKAARKAVTVQASSSLRHAAENANANAQHISSQSSKVRAVLKAMRPHQWSKNVLLFLPVLTAHDIGAIWDVLLGFVAFCLTASAVYVVNDLVDLTSDRAHPRKRKRPFAAGDLSAIQGLMLAGCLLLLSLFFGIMTGNPAFLAVLALYLATTFAYSLWLKRKLLVDVLALAGLYTVRIIAGGAAASIVLSPWLLGFSMFLFLALAAVKRQAELTDQQVTGRASSGRAYEVEDLPILRGVALSAGHAAVLVMALYISSEAVQPLYARPELLWLICPLLLYWVLRMVMMTHRGYMSDDPIVFAAKDKISLMVVASAVLVVLAAAL